SIVGSNIEKVCCVWIVFHCKFVRIVPPSNQFLKSLLVPKPSEVDRFMGMTIERHLIIVDNSRSLCHRNCQKPQIFLISKSTLLLVHALYPWIIWNCGSLSR